MASHVLFVVHGIGQHGTDWAEDAGGPIATLTEASRQYAYFGTTGLAARVEMVPVHYDEMFSQVIAAWQQNASAIDEFDTAGHVKTALGWLADASEDKFWWSHIADAVMYKFSPPYRQLVRSHVIAQLAVRIEQEVKDTGRATCSVLAHSLGTAVAHDCLHYLGSTRWGKRTSPLHPRHWRFQHVFMVANTSRLLESRDAGMAQAYTSIVRPGPVEDPASYCGTYWNFRHEFDPIAIPRRFDPAGWRNYTLEVVSHYHQTNIHGLSHYLEHPKVHVPILRKVVRSSAVTDAEFHHAVNPDQFPQFTVADVDQAKAHLLELAAQKLAVGENPTSEEFVRMLVTVYHLLEEFAS